MSWATAECTGARYRDRSMDPKTCGRQPDSTLWVPRAGLTLCVDEHESDRDHETVVLALCAADQTAAHWPASFLDALVIDGVDVVTFDHRDGGRSTRVPPDVGYRLDDLVEDAVGVLDALGHESVHVFGRSMGGMIAQLMALEHPERVRSLTLMSTTPGPDTDGLSPPDEGLVAAIAERLFEGAPADDAERVEWLVESQRLLSGRAFEFDVERERALARHDVKSGHPAESGHGTAVFATKPWIDRLGDIEVPCTVMHGERDPVYGLDHAQALASRIGADVAVLEGLGHEFPVAIGEQVAQLTLSTVSAARD
jgi:pimeloyl-ACP methyl ester carboxylesterase